MNRIIGEYIGNETGPLLIVFGAMHGNEPAGVKAIDLVLKKLEVEPIKNPDFEYKGYMLGIIGNLAAYEMNVRYINKDLNRSWLDENVNQLEQKQNFNEEQQQLLAILTAIENKIEEYDPTEVIILDLHTTSSDGGIFSIVGEDKRSLHIAKEIYAPVVLGMLEGLKGTTLHFFKNEIFSKQVATITFESGQHEDPLSVNRAIAAIVNCMRTIGSVKPTDVEHQHDHILKKYSEQLPRVARLAYKYHIAEGENFQMKAGYKNFQKVNAGETLAENRSGAICCEQDGMILMPLYQKKGDDGFFIIKEVHEAL